MYYLKYVVVVVGGGGGGGVCVVCNACTTTVWCWCGFVFIFDRRSSWFNWNKFIHLSNNIISIGSSKCKTHIPYWIMVFKWILHNCVWFSFFRKKFISGWKDVLQCHLSSLNSNFWSLFQVIETHTTKLTKSKWITISLITNKQLNWIWFGDRNAFVIIKALHF